MYTTNNSNSEFSWLLSPKKLPPPKECSREDLEKACKFVKQCWRVSPEILPRLVKWAGDLAEHSTSLESLKSDVIALRKYSQIQNSFLVRIASQLNKNNIPYSFLKSSALRWVIYEDPTSRISSDIDIAVASDFLENCKSVIVEELDFKPAQWSWERKRYEKANTFIRKAVEASHYELGYFVYYYKFSSSELTLSVKSAILNQVERYPELWFMDSNNELCCYIVLDIHHGLATIRNIGNIVVEPLIDTCTSVKINNSSLFIPSLPWTLLHLVYKIYWEGNNSHKNALYQYTDVCRIFLHMNDDHLHYFHSLLEDYSLEVAGYYVVKRLQTDFGISLSKQTSLFLERLSHVVDNGHSELHEDDQTKDMWSKLCSNHYWRS